MIRHPGARHRLALYMVRIIALWLLAATTHAVTIIDESTKSPLGIGNTLHYTTLTSDNLNDALKIPQSHWQQATHSDMAPGYDDNTWWFRTELLNQGSREEWQLDLQWPPLQHVSAWLTDGEQIIPLSTFKQGSRHPVFFGDHDFNMTLHKEKPYTLYFSLRSNSFIYLNPTLHTAQEDRNGYSFFALGQARTTFLQSCFFGLMITMTLYNFFIFYLTRERTYLTYVFYCGFMTLQQACLVGAIPRFTSPGISTVSDGAFVFFTALSYASAAIFTSHFLQLADHHYRRLELTFRSFAGLWVAVAVSAFFLTESFITQMIVPLSLAQVMLCLITPAYIYRRGNVLGLFYLAAWVFLLAAMAIFQLLRFSLVPANAFTLYGMQQIGIVIETVIISLALAHRMKAMKDTILIAKKRLIDHIQSYSDKLEKNVAERSREIAETRTKTQEAQKQIIHGQKILSLSMITKGITDDFNQPYGDLVHNTSHLQELTIDFSLFLHDLAQGEDGQEIQSVFNEVMRELMSPLDMISQGQFRIGTLIERLRMDRSFDTENKVDFDVGGSIRKALDRIHEEFPDVAASLTHNAVIQLKGWPQAFEEMFYQLIKNGCLATEDNAGKRKPQVRIYTRVEQSQLVIEVVDNGNGIAQGILSRIFDPFFTTRTVGKGAGLGLTMARDLVLSHQGQIECTRTDDTGTTIRVSIPL